MIIKIVTLINNRDGETLREIQNRNISALNTILEQYEGKNIIIGSHGTALSTISHYYDNSFGYEQFQEIKAVMPWIVQFTFSETKCIQSKKYNLLK